MIDVLIHSCESVLNNKFECKNDEAIFSLKMKLIS